MTPADLIRLQLVVACGLLEVQRRMVGAVWQVALWSRPEGAALPGAGSGCTPAGRRAADAC